VTLAAGIRYRPATPADLPACERVWRDGINDYLLPLGQYEVPADNPSLRSLHAHCLATDPERFWVATVPDEEPEAGVSEAGRAASAGPDRVVGFASAVRRGPVWFLSMLFVQPGWQLGGVGRTLLAHVLPAPPEEPTLVTVTDAAQPISNGLYASHGIVPRLPMFNLVGRPTRPEALAGLPGGVRAERMAADGAAGDGSEELTGQVAELDREVLGFAHPEDHAVIQAQGRVGFAYRDGEGALLGYGYASEIGRLGPLATRDPSLHPAIVAHLLGAVVPRGASAVWVPGEAAATTQMLVRAGLRMEGFPVLLCWTRPFADFARYVPISPGLL
jgi:GNAT superfamily N-acetyltransferase